MELYDLNTKDDYFFGYDEDCDPGILNEFSAAAFRFGHTQISELFKLLQPEMFSLFKNYSDDFVLLRHHFNDPDIALRYM